MIEFALTLFFAWLTGDGTALAQYPGFSVESRDGEVARRYGHWVHVRDNGRGEIRIVPSTPPGHSERKPYMMPIARIAPEGAELVFSVSMTRDEYGGAYVAIYEDRMTITTVVDNGIFMLRISNDETVSLYSKQYVISDAVDSGLVASNFVQTINTACPHVLPASVAIDMKRLKYSYESESLVLRLPLQ